MTTPLPEPVSPQAKVAELLAPPRATHRGWRIALQLVGFAISLALLMWVIHIAFKAENAEKLKRLAQAPLQSVALLLSLSLASLLLNGAKFWIVIRPVRTLRFWDVQAINAMAAFVSYLPFKLSLVLRMIVHNRRDGVAVLTIGAWIGAVGVILVAALAPLLAVSVWRKHIDLLFLVVGIGGLIIGAIAMILFARLFAGNRGLARLHRIFGRIPGVTLILHSAPFLKAHTGFDMLASPVHVSIALAIRVADLLVQAARFLIAASILGTPLAFDSAILAACAFYLIGVASPSGSLGARESGTTGIASLLTFPGMTAATFAPIALTVSASEVIINLTGAVLGALWIRPWNLMVARKTPPASSASSLAAQNPESQESPTSR